MKKLILAIMCLTLVFAFASCDLLDSLLNQNQACEHIDENSDLVCDKCEESINNENEGGNEKPECTHRDADDDYLCDECGESFDDGKDVEDKPECNHRDADDDYLCDECGEKFEDGDEELPQHTHKDADDDCLCDVCGENFDDGKDVFDSCEHVWINATCTADGYCVLCGAIGESAKGHNYIDGYCEFCGMPDPNYIPECKHEWSEAGCEFDSYCIFCGMPGESAKGHNYIDGYCEFCGMPDPNYIPECKHEWSEVGCEFDSYCIFCGMPGESAKGHNYIDGYCEFCGYPDPNYKPECMHSWIDPTCTENGYCIMCGMPGESAKGHSYVVNITPPTCSEAGYTIFTCSACSYQYKTVQSATGHTAGEWKETITPTCKFNGERSLYCAVCNGLIGKQDIPASDDYHSYIDNICVHCGEVDPDSVYSSEGLYIALDYTKTHYIVYGLGTCTDKDIVIPAVFNGLPVTEIGSGAFQYEFNITSVVVPEGVTKIGSNAFYGASNLKKVTLPDSVVTLEMQAFAYCTRLEEVNIPLGITKIESYTFCDCLSLKEIIIPDNVTKILSYAFLSCSSAEKIVIPESLVSIASGAFSGCDPKILELPEHLRTSLKSSFDDIYTDPDYYDEIIFTEDGYVFVYDIDGYYLYKYLGNETNLILPDSINGKSYGIYTGAFEGRNDIYSIVLSDGVTEINSRAFSNMKNLISITIGKNVTRIYDYSFSGCEKLVQIYNLSKITLTAGSYDYGNIAKYAKDIYTSLDQTSKLFTTPDGYVFYMGDTASLIGYVGTESDLVLPESIGGGSYEISPFALAFNNAITSVTISAGVSNIGAQAFYSSYNIKNISVSADNGAYASIDGVLVSKDLKTLIYYPIAKTDSIYRIPDSICVIESYAFYYADSLLEVYFGKEVVEVKDYAFSNCLHLSTIDLGRKLETVGYQFIAGCGSLYVVIIPNTMTNIEYGTFGYELRHYVYYTGTEAEWETLKAAATNLGFNDMDTCHVTCNYVG